MQGNSAVLLHPKWPEDSPDRAAADFNLSKKADVLLEDDGIYFSIAAVNKIKIIIADAAKI